MNESPIVNVCLKYSGFELKILMGWINSVFAFYEGRKHLFDDGKQ